MLWNQSPHNMLKKILPVGLLTGFFLGCASSGSLLPSSPPPVFELDLSGTLDGVQWSGTAVGEDFQKHDIKIQSKTDVNYMTIQSCHRFEKYEDVIKTGWFKSNRGFEYIYSESPGLEDTGFCVLRLAAFSKQVGAGEAYGIMLFHNRKFQLWSENICNGADQPVTGSGMCQSMSGLVQHIKFKSQVVTAGNGPDGNAIPGQCNGKFIDANTFEYTVPTGECIAVFMTTAQPHQFGIYLVYGFDKSQYRGSE